MEGKASMAGGGTGLKVDGQQIAGERRRLEVDDMLTLTGKRARRRRDELGALGFEMSGMYVPPRPSSAQPGENCARYAWFLKVATSATQPDVPAGVSRILPTSSKFSFDAGR
jgi:hypothetical protein